MFASPDGRFKVQMPAAPQEESYVTDEGVHWKFYGAEYNGFTYSVAFAEFPHQPGSSAAVEAALDAAREGGLRNVRAALRNEARISLGGKHRGREIEADLPDGGTIRSRLFLVDRRLYMAVITSANHRVGSADATRFLDSLVVTEAPFRVSPDRTLLEDAGQ